MDSSDISGCMLVLSGFPADASELRRTHLLAAFIDAGAGGVISWLTPQDVLVVYRSQEGVEEANQLVSTLRRYSLVDYPGDLAAALRVGREVFENSFRPRRDVSVANRFIGSALGIRVQQPAVPSRPKPRAPSPPREDAWD